MGHSFSKWGILTYSLPAANCANSIGVVGTGSTSISSITIYDNGYVEIITSQALASFEITNSGDQQEYVNVTATCNGSTFTSNHLLGSCENNSPARWSGTMTPWCSEIYGGRGHQVTSTLSGSGGLNVSDTYTVMH